MSRHQIDFVVDTNPMAKEVAGVSNHVKQTTAAVVSMQTAVVASESAAAQKVVTNVNTGFYSLIHSQLSQKMAKLKSDADSHLMNLTQLSSKLQLMQGRMGKDYNMLKQRYAKLFGKINKELSNRVYALDSSVMDYFNKNVAVLDNRNKLLISSVPVNQSESVKLSQQIPMSLLKHKTYKAIGQLSNYLETSSKQASMTDNALQAITMVVDHKEVMLPAIVFETINDRFGNSTLNVFFNDSILPTPSKQKIINTITSESGAMQWKESSLDDGEKKELNRLINNSDKKERVLLLVKEMSSNSKILTMKEE